MSCAFRLFVVVYILVFNLSHTLNNHHPRLTIRNNVGKRIYFCAHETEYAGVINIYSIHPSCLDCVILRHGYTPPSEVITIRRIVAEPRVGNTRKGNDGMCCCTAACSTGRHE